MDRPLLPFSIERMFEAVRKVHERLDRVTAVLNADGVPYAVVGAPAVAWWVTRAGQGGERNTPNVDVMVDAADVGRAVESVGRVGFVRRPDVPPHWLVDGPDGHPKQRLMLLPAGERVRPTDLVPTPTLVEVVRGERFPVVDLEPLTRMKLTANRLIDRVHVRDMIDVGLIDATWPGRFPPELGRRLQELLDTPDG